jgi:hypothetical protein
LFELFFQPRHISPGGRSSAHDCQPICCFSPGIFGASRHSNSRTQRSFIKVLRIAGTPDLRQALEERLRNDQNARYFIYEEAGMYTQRESELLQHFLQQHGRLPSGNDLSDDLF